MTNTKANPAGPKLGAHISAAGGAFNAPGRGLQIGCRSIQIFTRNQTQWKSKPLIDEDLVRFHQAIQKTGIGPTLAHDSYLINLGSPDDSKWKQSREAFDDEIHRAEQLQIDYLVFHPGAHMGSGEE
jgi:deoxyribonuclease-4